MENKRHNVMNIGIISFIVIFVILCLITFSILSYVSASNNEKMNTKTIEHTSENYQLDYKADQILDQISQILLNHYKQYNEQNYYSHIYELKNIDSSISINNHSLSYEVNGTTQKLIMTIDITYSQDLFKIKECSVQSNKEWENDTSIDVL